MAAIAGCIAWFRHGSAPHAHEQAPLQAAVLTDGFAVARANVVRELDRQGRIRAEYRVPRDRQVRVVGTRVGVAAAWLDNARLELALLKTGESKGWGKSASVLCDGAASNDSRFAVAWREDSGGLWFVHGPMSAADVPTILATDAQWCGVASAGDRIALFWRDRGRLLFNTCTPVKCSPLPASVALAPSTEVVGFGCLANACLLAARASNGSTELLYATESGAVKWRKPLGSIDGRVEIIGIAGNAFAVGVPGRVVHYDRRGRSKDLWTGHGTPALAWSRGLLLVAHANGQEIVEVPR